MNQAIRIQTSFINGLEKKALIWIAKRLPRWVTSDMLTAVGTLGALVVAIGFALSGDQMPDGVKFAGVSIGTLLRQRPPDGGFLQFRLHQ